ncbi:hypothetical protein WT22_16990 [Burkholderia territorii]|nr:hypothetical protein WT22_16990 [Burkholderia territorii]KWA30919.1 hypothetical protein WT40_21835 [Burkholderia territorii]
MGQFCVDIPPDHPVTCPPLALPAGTRITLGIRPEDIELDTDSRKAAAGRIELIEERGDTRIEYCLLGGATVAAVLPRDQHVSEGNTVGISLRSRSLHAFERGNGSRLTLFAELD